MDARQLRIEVVHQAAEGCFLLPALQRSWLPRGARMREWRVSSMLLHRPI